MVQMINIKATQNGQTGGKGAKAAKRIAQAFGNVKVEQAGGKTCKWCEQGECWSHGQIERPAGAPAAKKQKTKGSNPFAGGAAGGAAGGLQGLLSNPQISGALLQGLLQGGGQGAGGILQMLQAAAGGAAAESATSVGDAGGWKQVLNQSLSKSKGTPITKDDIVYEVTQVESKGKPSFQATVNIDGQSYAGECEESKKKAESSAAQVAVQDLFPDQYQPSEKQEKSDRSKAQKQEAQSNNKMQLNMQVQCALGRPVTKGEIAYETTGEEGVFLSTCTVSELSNVTYKGKQSANAKEAEQSAAAMAMKGLKGQLVPAMAAHAEKKTAKNKAACEKMKAAQAEKKAAKAAAA